MMHNDQYNYSKIVTSDDQMFHIRKEIKREDENHFLDHGKLFKKKLWKAKDVAMFLECSLGHIYNLSSRDLIPKKKKGKFLYFDPKEILEWIHEGDFHDKN